MGAYSALYGWEMRILTIKPGEGSASIDCALDAVPFGDSASYEAISYSWGLLPPTNPINIQNGETVTEFHVTKHLFDALWRFRLPHTPVTLWIDAICIDQSNLLEKNHQVTRMTEIYASAEGVRIWLGEGDETSDMAMDFILEILDQHGTISQPAYDQKRQALNQLLARNWFSRRWIIQELAFANDASIFCGSKYVSWRDFADAVSMYSVICQDVGAGLRSYEEITRLGAHSLIYASNNLFRRDASRREILFRLVPLETLLQRLIQFQSTEPRDIIYAILALGKDTYLTDKIWVDYEMPVWEVYRDAIKIIVDQSVSLDIICKPWAPKQDGLPSWIPSSEASPFAMSKDGTFFRQNADLLVGEHGSSPYRACGRSTASTAKYDLITSHEPPNQLLADGFILDEVGACGDVAVGGVVPWNWLRLGAWEDVYDKPPPEEFWRTLVADRDGEGNNPPSWYQRICQEVFRHGSPLSGLDLKNLPETAQTPNITRELVHRIQATIWNRQLMRTALNDSLGLIPSKARKGDLICIMEGCSVPVIMRRIEVATHSNSQTLEEQVLTSSTDQPSIRPVGIQMQQYVKKLRKFYDSRGANWDDGWSEDDIFYDDSDRQSLDRYVSMPPFLARKEDKYNSLKTEKFDDNKGDDEACEDGEDEYKSLKTEKFDDDEGDDESCEDGEVEIKNVWDVDTGHHAWDVDTRHQFPKYSHIDLECMLIGECFMYGVMDGEAMELTHSGGIEPIKFGIF